MITGGFGRKRKTGRGLSRIIPYLLIISLMYTDIVLSAPYTETESLEEVTGTEEESEEPDTEVQESEDPDTEVQESSTPAVSVRESGSETSAVPEADTGLAYDPQPESMAEVQAAIDAYASAGYVLSAKPHWEYEVAAAWMPAGYRCELVSGGDAFFRQDYYSFFAKPKAAVSTSVATFDQLQAACANTAIDEIIVTADIDATAAIVLSGRTVTVKGQSGTEVITMEVVSTSADATRHFRLSDSSILTLETITLRGGGAASAGEFSGGVYSHNSTLNLKRTVIEKCCAESGGAVNMVSGVITIQDESCIRENVASRKGGGVYVGTACKMSASNSTISDNETIGEGDSGAESDSGSGGGIGYGEDAEVEMVNVTVSGNVAMVSGGGIRGSGPIKLTDCDIVGNVATNGIGGGIYAAGSLGLATITGGKISNNTGSLGGGLYVNLFSMTDVEVSDNTATVSGGGIYSNKSGGNKMQGTTVKGNRCGETGGGIYGSVADYEIDMDDCLFYKNDAGSYGGGVYTLGSSGAVRVTNSRFIGNDSGTSTGDGRGGAMYILSSDFFLADSEVRENHSSGTGGGIYFAQGSSTQGAFTMENSKILKNESNQDGGGVFILRGTFTMKSGEITDNIAGSSGGGVAIEASNATSSASMKMQSGTISGNTAGSTGNVYGGGVHVFGGTLELEGGTISDNHGRTGAGVSIVAPMGQQPSIFLMTGGTVDNNHSNWNGGGIGVYYGGSYIGQGGPVRATISGGRITNNDALYNGAGIYIYGLDAEMDLTGSAAIGSSGNANKSGTNGAGVYAGNAATVRMDSGSIAYNEAGAIGGGVYLNAASFILENASIAHNTSTTFGGGVGTTDGSFVMKSGTISENKTNGGTGGGGVYATGSNAEIEMSGGSITKHTGEAAGGGAYLAASATLTMSGGSITENEVTNTGGGIYLTRATAVVSNGSSIARNTAQTSGGGVYSTAATFTLEGGIISDNQVVSGNGGGLYALGTSSTSYRSIISITEGAIKNHTGITSGAGIYLGNYATLTMSGGSIVNNEAASYGGGICGSGTGTILNVTGNAVIGDLGNGNKAGTRGGGVTLISGTFNMDNGSIADNTAPDAGGAYINVGTFNMSGGSITNNQASKNGGGVYLNTSTLTMTAGSITGNTAAVDGGGIYTSKYSYTNPAVVASYSQLAVSGSTVSGNTAGTTYGIPVNAAEFSDFDGTLLNNDQINYKGPYVITYRANNGTAPEPYEYQSVPSGTGGASAALWANNGLTGGSGTSFSPPPGMSFDGWNTQADGLGTSYAPADMVSITDSTLVLYAQWKMTATFEFYKVSAADDHMFLSGAGFRLYQYTGSGTPNGLIDPASPGSNWTDLGAETSDSGGAVAFAGITPVDGAYYQLVETAAPANFKLPSGQWLIRISVNSTTGAVSFTPTQVAGADGAVPPAFKYLSGGTYDGALALTNIPEQALPAMGGGGTAGYLRMGLAIILLSGVLGILKVSARRRKGLKRI